MPSANWKSSSLPMRMSVTEAISWKAARSSVSRPFQKEARWLRSKAILVPLALAMRATSRQNWLDR
ncbi:Uncharacterised protein [Mycobacteroides abscessus subsp. abscessus]|nr:Uncharacterised protein [Mycobacteroides abscessus subsp. abscessus]